jgi:hypothetical protein
VALSFFVIQLVNPKMKNKLRHESTFVEVGLFVGVELQNRSHMN